MRLPAPLEHLQRRLAQAWHERAVTLKAASFAMVGVVNTLVDYCVFLAGYYHLGLPLIPANVLSWLVAVSGSYVMNSYVTLPWSLAGSCAGAPTPRSWRPASPGS